MNPPIRTATRALCAAVLAGAVTVVVLNQKSLARERSENQALLRDQAEVAQLTMENGELEQLRNVNQAVEKLRVENHDLPRLRNEASQWRDQAGEAAKLRAENQRLAAAPLPGPAVAAMPADFIPREKLADVGLATPEAALQTFLHAMSQGDFARLEQCSLNPPPQPTTQEQEDQQRARLQQEGVNFPGYRIAGKTFLSADEVQLDMQCAPGGVIAPIKLKLVNGEWKMSQ